MNKKLILSEIQLKKLVNEEMGISNFVSEKANEIYSLVEDALYNCKEDTEKFDNYTIKKSSINFLIFETKVSCTIEFYNFYNREYYEYSNIESNGWSAYLGKRLCFMGLTIPCVSGTIIKSETIDTIQHELEHIYQQVMMTDSMSYAKVKTNMCSENELINKTARLVYGCIKSEQDGFVNGLYAYLMSLPEFFSMDSFKKSSTWKLYVEMVNIYNEFINNPNFIIELKKYKLNPKKVEQKINQFVGKIGKVVSKVQKDKYEKQGWKN